MNRMQTSALFHSAHLPIRALIKRSQESGDYGTISNNTMEQRTFRFIVLQGVTLCLDGMVS